MEDKIEGFDKLLSLEEQFIDDGIVAGLKFGEKAGFEEGFKMGENVGNELGTELGFYAGCQLIWIESLDSYSMRARKAIEAFGELIKAFPMENNLSEDYMEKMLRIRAKFKVIISITQCPNLQYTKNAPTSW